jgi:alpha-ketoglutarate-dependent taurine dioxygenase
MRNTRFEVRLTSGALGAELLGIDLAHALDAEAVADIRRAFHEHGVIFFRDQRLKPEQHIAFAERMGPININRFFQNRTRLSTDSGGTEGTCTNDRRPQRPDRVHGRFPHR